MLIKSITIKKILNSLGDYTLECTMQSEQAIAKSSVPQGKSAGISEAVMLDAKIAIANFEKIKINLIDKHFATLNDFDNLLIQLDGTENKANLGGNLTLVLSITFVKLLALEANLSLYNYISTTFQFKLKIPDYFLLIFEGGKHGSELITAQEYMLLVSNITECQQIITDVKRYLDSNKLFVGYGLEGAFTSSKLSDMDVLNLLKLLFSDKKIAIDVAQSSREEPELDYEAIVNNYNIYSIEDPKNETDFVGWEEFYNRYSSKIVIIGDDLTTTNISLIQKAIDHKTISGVIIKPNQIGTVTETINAVRICKSYGLKVIVSHRGGDTNDSFIADLCVGVGADFVKFGGLQRGERIAKYNRLEEIREELKSLTSVSQI